MNMKYLNGHRDPTVTVAFSDIQKKKKKKKFFLFFFFFFYLFMYYCF